MPRPPHAKPPPPFKRINSSPEVIRLVVLIYVRFPLSLRNVEDLLFERGIDICHETIRFCCNRFGPLFAGDIRRQQISAMRAKKWRNGAMTLHGLHIYGFPDFMQLTSWQSVQSTSFTHQLDGIATHVAYIIRQALGRNASTVEATAEAEADGVSRHEQKSVAAQKT